MIRNHLDVLARTEATRDQLHGQYRRIFKAVSPRVARYAARTTGWHANQHCAVCQEVTPWYYAPVLWPKLKNEWQLDTAWSQAINEREGRRCLRCNCSLRSVHLASTLASTISELAGIRLHSVTALPWLAKVAPSLRIAEFNMAGDLHRYLRTMPNLYYSEYGSSDTSVPHQDLMCLSVPDQSFDVVVTSDTLEHIPSPRQAIAEIARVLRPGGAHVFTTPVVWGRPNSRRRADVVDGELVHYLPPSFHGTPTKGRSADSLVFFEFGDDVLGLIEHPNMRHEVKYAGPNAAVCNFVGWKRGGVSRGNLRH